MFPPWYLAFRTGYRASRTASHTLVFRFIGSLFGTASIEVSLTLFIRLDDPRGAGTAVVLIEAATIGDNFDPRGRGKAMAVYSMAPLIVPILGPFPGGFRTQYLYWRWTFFSAFLINAAAH